VADSTTTTSNMAVMEVSFPSGFTFDSDSLEELKATENVKVSEVFRLESSKLTQILPTENRDQRRRHRGCCVL
jgi:A-macroglobulin receptor binding domain